MSPERAHKVNIGLIGAGRIGLVHARHIARSVPNARLAAVADSDLAAAQACGRAVGVDVAVRDYRRLLDDPAIHAVAICSSTDTHARIVVDAAQAGKDIFCEKPLDLDLGRIDEILAAVERTGVKLQVGFNRRFDSSFGRVREIVSAGEIGEPHVVRITSRDPGPPPLDYIRASGGLFLDMTIHDFDMARFLVGREVQKVFAQGAVLVDRAIGAQGDIDTALITLQFEGGCLGAIENSRRAVYGYDQRVEVFGSAGSVSAGNAYPNTVTTSKRGLVTRDPPLHFFIERYHSAYLAELQAFVDCVLRDESPPVTGRDGRAPVAIALAAQKSMETGMAVQVQPFP